MSLFSDNIRTLRIRQKISQEKIAESFSITRGRYVKYEDGTSEPPYEILRKMSLHFGVSIDVLLSVDVRKIQSDDLLTMEDNRLLLPIIVDRDGENIIEIIPQKARAGYLTGYADPEFIENLQHISLPWLKNGKFRGFPVEGDSMPPHKNGDFIVGKYIEKLGDVLDGKTYILLTKNQGIVYKRLNKNGKNALMLVSDNTFYEPYVIKASEILEIWQYACSLATKEFTPDDMNTSDIRTLLMELRKEITEVKSKIN